MLTPLVPGFCYTYLLGTLSVRLQLPRQLFVFRVTELLWFLRLFCVFVLLLPLTDLVLRRIETLLFGGRSRVALGRSLISGHSSRECGTCCAAHNKFY